MEREHIDDKRWCHLHPEELMIGVCALCLHQRLLVLAKKQHNKNHKSSSSVSSVYLHKVFAFGSLLDRKRKSDQSATASISQQDSFISINLEDNSIASKKEIVGKAMIKRSSVEEHTKARSCHVRWPNRIGHWLKLVSLKKRRPTSRNSSSAKVVNANSHVPSNLQNLKRCSNIHRFIPNKDPTY